MNANLCPACGTENLPGEMFCSDCGTPLQAPLPEPGLGVDAAAGITPIAETVTEAASAVTAEAEDAGSMPSPESAESVAAVETAPAAVTPDLACTACGAKLEAGDLFCHACGSRVQSPAATAPVAPEPAVTAEQAAQTVASIAGASVPAAPVQADVCPACGAHVTPGEVFCQFCGAALISHPPQPTASAPIMATSPAPAAGASGTTSAHSGPVLIVAETGTELPLAQGTEALVGREDPYTNVYPDVDLTPFGAEDKGVSRRHFKLTLAEGQYAVQDLASTNYTWLNQQRLQPNVPVSLKDGDEIRAGRLKLVFRSRP